MSGDLLILFTMDVELPSRGPESSGPVDNEVGARRVLEYFEVLRDYGYTPTFFVHPELGRTQADIFLDLKERGASIGLHIHAAKIADGFYGMELGAHPSNTQKEIIESGIAMFEEYFGFRPDIFRPGCFSANDSTYRVLTDLGFKGGGISIPGRVWNERYCAWSGAYPHAHYAHENFRLLEGDLNFVDIPLSVDRSKLVSHPLGFKHYFDLRPGDVYTAENVIERDHKQILSNIVSQIAADDPILKTIVVDVHNDREFKDVAKTPARQLREVLDNIEPELNKFGLKPVDATYDKAIELFQSRRGRSVK